MIGTRRGSSGWRGRERVVGIGYGGVRGFRFGGFEGIMGCGREILR